MLHSLLAFCVAVALGLPAFSLCFAEPLLMACCSEPPQLNVQGQMINKRRWGPEQVTGAPNSPAGVDSTTAWASATADGRKEWLICTYEKSQEPVEIVIHETYNPGAVYKITVLGHSGQETLAWEGVDSTRRDQKHGISVFPVKLGFPIQKVKIHIDSPAVPGWNEIDAVGLRTSAGEIQWADHVEASTMYGVQAASQPVVVSAAMLAQHTQRLVQLEHEIRQLRGEVKELNALLRKYRELLE